MSARRRQPSGFRPSSALPVVRQAVETRVSPGRPAAAGEDAERRPSRRTYSKRTNACPLIVMIASWFDGQHVGLAVHVK